MAMMPIMYSSLPFYVAAFATGVVARRNEWLATLLASPGLICMRIYTVTTFLLMVTILVLDYLFTDGELIVGSAPSPSPPPPLPSSPPNQTISSAPAPLAAMDATTALGMAGEPQAEAAVDLSNLLQSGVEALEHNGISAIITLPASAVCVPATLSALSYFHQHFNIQTRATAFLNANAYSAYLLHPYVITLVLYVYVVVLRTTDTAQIAFARPCGPDESNYGKLEVVSHTHISEGFIWLGFGSVSLVGGLLTWGLAEMLRRCPGARRVL